MRSLMLLAAAALALGACSSAGAEADRLELAADAFRWDVGMSERDLASVRADLASLEEGATRAALLGRADQLSEDAENARLTLDRAATSEDLKALSEDLARLREGVDALRHAATAARS